jgi:DNA-binding response OmpR family regulator
MAKVLIADDEEDFVKGLVIRLNAAGFDGVAVTDGEQVITECQKEKPDLIVLDVMMPKMDGLQVCRTLKANPATSTIPIIFLTAGAFDIAEALDDLARGQDFLLKTINGEEIIERIKTILKK